MLKLKNTVWPPSLVIAAALINAATVLELDADMWITSANDSTHMKGSKHYSDEAIDFRTKHLSKGDKVALLTELRRRLGKHYDVILEEEGKANEHGHAEHDPE